MRPIVVALILGLLAVIAWGSLQPDQVTVVVPDPIVLPAECAGLTDYYVAKCDPSTY